MFKITAKDEIHAIIMGGPSGFGADVTALLGRLGIGMTCCGDVYSALAEIVEKSLVGGKILVIGSLAQLCVEDMRFLEICAGRDDTSCCCFVNEKTSFDIKSVLQILGTKAFLAVEISDLESILTEIGTVKNALQEQ